MSARLWARRSALLLWAATLVVAATGLALLVWDWSTPVPSGSFGVRGFSGLWAVGFGSVGALLTWRRPGHPVGWVFAAAGLLAAVDFASFEYALAAVVGHRGLPAGEYVGWLQLWIWVPFVALITVYLFLLFPDGRLPGPGWRLVSWLAGGFGVMAITGLALTPGTVANLPALRNPFGVAPACGAVHCDRCRARRVARLCRAGGVVAVSRAAGAGHRWSGSRSSGWPTPAAWWR